MERFVHRQNIERYKKQLEETRDEDQRNVLRKLLADEEAKDSPPPKARSRTS